MNYDLLDPQAWVFGFIPGFCFLVDFATRHHRLPPPKKDLTAEVKDLWEEALREDASSEAREKAVDLLRLQGHTKASARRIVAARPVNE